MRNNTKTLLVLGIIWLYLSNFFGYNDFARFKLPYVIECLLYALPILMVIFKGSGIRHTMHFHKEVILLMILPFISGISSMMEFNQGLYETVVACIPSLLWGTYFFLHKNNVPHDKALRFLLFFSLIGMLIMTVQQFFPEKAMFGVSVSTESDEIAEVRNGLYRFRIGGAGCAGLFLFAYYWGKTVNSYNRRWLAISFCLLLYLYLTLTRIVILSVLLIVILTFFMRKKGNSATSFLLVLCFLSFLFIFRDTLFGAFIEQTSEQTSNSDDVRFLEYTFFLNEILTKPIIFVLGTGVPHASSSLGDYYRNLEQLHLFSSDIGLIGTWFNYGILYVVLFVWCIYKMCIKLRHLLPTYFKAYWACVLVVLPLAFPWVSNLSNLMWCFILYIIDLEIENKKQIRTICH